MAYLTCTSCLKGIFKLIPVLFLFLLSNVTHAQWVWDGSADGKWHTAANWNLNSVPPNGANVVIAFGLSFPIIESSTANINKLEIELGAHLFISENGTLNVIKTTTDDPAPKGAIEVIDGILYSWGTINVEVLGNANNAIYVLGGNGQVSSATTDSGISGTINLNNPTGRGILVRDGAIFINEGSTLNIGNTGPIGADGIKILNGIFKNESVHYASNPNNIAVINISNTAGNGIGIFDRFYNLAGEINIGVNGAIAKTGLKVSTGIFTNECDNTNPTNPITGTVNINTTTLDAIYSNGEIENDGKINIGSIASVAGHGINNDEEFINNGVIEIDGLSTPSNYAIYNSNTGISFINGVCQSAIHIHSDNIIFDEKNTFTNNGLIIENASGTSDIQTNNGTVANFNGGTFNMANNNGRTVANIGDRLWMGCSDTDWSNVDNWYPNGVPLDSDIVYIDGWTQPTIDATTFAYGKELYITAGATLTNNGGYAGYSDIIIENGGTLTGNGNYYLGQDWENNGTFLNGTSKVTFNGPVTGKILGNSTNTFYDLDINKFTDDALVTVEDNFTVTGDLSITFGEFNILTGKTISGELIEVKNNGTLTNNGTLDISDININGTLINDGILDVTNFLWLRNSGTMQGNGEYQMETAWAAEPSATFFPGTSKVIMNGNNDISTIYINNNNNIEFYDLEINKSSGSVEIVGYLDVLNEATVLQGTLSISSGERLLPKNLIIEPNGVFDLSSLAIITGNWTNNGSFVASSNSNVFFNGDTQSQIGGTSTTKFAKMYVNKSASNVQANTDFEVTNEITMNAGNLDLNGYTLTMKGLIKDESANSYIYGDGHIAKTTDLIAPIAINAGNLGVEITSSANLGSTTIERYHQSETINEETCIQRYYDISPTYNADLDATVKFYYLDHELNGIVESDLAPFRDNGSEWEGYDAINQDLSLNFVETNQINAFSKWTLGSSSVLPVELTDYTAKKTDKNQVLLHWQTANELNNEGFEIQHSTDGRNWGILDFVVGKGMTSLTNNYNYLHEQPKAGSNYYRLKQQDYDGQFEYSKIEMVKFSNLFGFLVYPNPVSEVLKIEVQETYETGNYKLLDSAGKVVKLALLDGGQLQEIQMHDLPKGNYFLQISINGKQQSKQIMIQ